MAAGSSRARSARARRRIPRMRKLNPAWSGREWANLRWCSPGSVPPSLPARCRATTRVGLGTSVLVLPYRPPLLVAKWVATVQELSGGRLMLGVGIGWMAAEFRALGVDYRRRGALSEEALDLLDRCFAADVVEVNGQPFLFRPRPSRPPLFVGGQPPFAFRRALAHRGGWMPMGLAPDALAPCVAELRAAAAGRGLPSPEVAVLTSLPLEDLDRTRTLLVRYAEAGAARVIHGAR